MKAINIQWDVDGNDDLFPDLPKEIEIPNEVREEEEISDYISSETGFCHFGFDLVL